MSKFIRIGPRPLAPIIPFDRVRVVSPARPNDVAENGDSSNLALPDAARSLFSMEFVYEMPAAKAKRLRKQWSIRTLINAHSNWVRGMVSIESDELLTGVDDRVALIIDDLIILSDAAELYEAMQMLAIASYESGSGFRFLAEFVRRGCDEARDVMKTMQEEQLYLMIAQYDHTYGISYAMGEIYGVDVAKRSVQRVDREDDALGMSDHEVFVRAYKHYRAMKAYAPLRSPSAPVLR